MTTLPMKHPSEWKAVKKVGHPTYALAVAIAWHKRLSAADRDPAVLDGDVEALDDQGNVIPTLDPHGNETRPMTEAAFDALVAEAQQLLRRVRADVVSKPVNGRAVKAQSVRILPHPSLDHAVVVRVADEAESRQMLAQIRDAGDGALDVTAALFTERLLWPAVGSAEMQQLMDHFAMAFRPHYPDEYFGLLGYRAAEVKKRA